MPLQATSGAASYDAFGGGAAAVVNYIEDVFSTWLYNGNGSTQTITNNIDLSGKGGLVWIKDRTVNFNNVLSDTQRGATKYLISNNTSAQATNVDYLTSFNNNGFSIGSASDVNRNVSSDAFVSWTFRKQQKFFDIVAYTGNGANRAISHNLGSTPGFIVIKKLSDVASWFCYHRSLGPTLTITLNSSNQSNTDSGVFNNTSPTSTQFTVGGNFTVNESGQSYIAYLFAHNAGGFGLTGNDNVITCGSFTHPDSFTGATVTLGYEPQFVLIKKSSNTGDWFILDTMRGWDLTGSDKALAANTADAESTFSGTYGNPTATGFVTTATNLGDGTFIYIAIRRGPMKVPTVGTSVFATAFSPSGLPGFVSNFPVDFATLANRSTLDKWYDTSRLTGTLYLNTARTDFEQTLLNAKFDYQNGWYSTFFGGTNYYSYMFQRAPGFFDEVCYTGTGSATTQTHNLGVAPELLIVKKRSSTSDWSILQTALQKTYYLPYTSAGEGVNVTYFGNDTVYIAPTSTVFYLGSASAVNGVAGQTFVAYLFATCPGVSKVGSYTGTGATQTIDCGFTGGARFVLIKRSDSTGDWYVWDTARGMVAGTDPSLLLNSTAAEVNANSVYTTGVGFQIVSTAAGINASGGTYIFLAVA
jgi:hypothetical protein